MPTFGKPSPTTASRHRSQKTRVSTPCDAIALGWADQLYCIAVEAHGGLKRWSQLTVVKASVFITGELWQLKAQPEDLGFQPIYRGQDEISGIFQFVRDL
jgi:hypothetical protein